LVIGHVKKEYRSPCGRPTAYMRYRNICPLRDISLRERAAPRLLPPGPQASCNRNTCSTVG
jgi:hypothetical protein